MINKNIYDSKPEAGRDARPYAGEGAVLVPSTLGSIIIRQKTPLIMANLFSLSAFKFFLKKRFHMSMRSHSICISLCDLIQLASCPHGQSIEVVARAGGGDW